MLRNLAVILALICCGATVQAGADRAPRPLASAFEAMQRGDWQRAALLAQRDGPVAETMIEWFRLRAGLGSFVEVQGFLERHHDWPGLDLLRRRSEGALSEATPAEVIAFFASSAPQTGSGALALAAAQRASGRAETADATLIDAWRRMELTEAEHRAFLADHARLLAPYHRERLEMGLWRGLESDVSRMMALVPEDARNLAKARSALKSGKRGVNALIDGLTPAQQADSGLSYDRFIWRVQKGSGTDAANFMQERSQSAAMLGQPEKWSGWRHYLAHGLMRDGKSKQAYALASSHHLTAGANYAELEWLAGYIALRKLKDPKLALSHFQRFSAAVDSPISLGRAGYWLGVTHEALGDAAAADMAFHSGAQHQTSFYGLLSAEKLGQPLDPELAGTEVFPPWRKAEFVKNEVFRAGELALSSAWLSTAEQFFLHLAEKQDRTGLGQLGAMAMDLNAPHLAVMLGKHGAARGVTLPAPYYALHPMHNMKFPVPTEMALAIARRESEFDPSVVSGAGAQGLMQLMPGTAAEVARDLGLEHDPAQVLADWRYNATLGSAYLARLATQFDGNVVLVAAGYNAGPSRPVKWMDEMGDPRKGGVDIVDWIEHIPFRETRNYVMRVAESLPVYRARLGRTPLPVPFSRELTGSTVLPLSP